MSLKAVEAIKEGLDRLGTRNAVIIASAYFTLTILNASITDTVLARYSTFLQLPETSTTPLALPIPGFIAGFLIIPLIAASAAVGITALRVFASDERDLIPRKLYRENIGKAVLNVIVGGVAFGIVIALLAAIPLIPGILVGMTGMSLVGGALTLVGLLFSIILVIAAVVKMYFWTAAVSIDDESFIQGYKTSWDLTEGNIISVGILLLAIFVLSILVSMVFNIPSLIGLNIIGSIISSIGAAITSTLTSAVIASAYNQLKQGEDDQEDEDYIYKGDSADDESSEDSSEDGESEGNDDEEDTEKTDEESSEKKDESS